MDTKSIFKSKTFWANVLFVAVALAKHFGVDQDGATLDEGTIAALIGAANIGLRIVTSQGVHLKG